LGRIQDSESGKKKKSPRSHEARQFGSQIGTQEEEVQKLLGKSARSVKMGGIGSESSEEI